MKSQHCPNDGYEYTQGEIAEAMGITHQAVAQIEEHGILAIWRMQVSEEFRQRREWARRSWEARDDTTA